MLEVNGKSDGCNSAEKEVTSDMTLVWSEEDDDDETVQNYNIFAIFIFRFI